MSLIPSAYRGAPSDDPLGSVVLGCRLERIIGRGGMGAAYLARRETDGQAVVVKLLAPELAGDAELRRRFEREAEALTKLPPHPHLVGVLGARGGERPAIVMEHIAGESLQALLHARGRLAPAEAAGITQQIALGLGAAHAAGLVHRDLKPGNVIITPDGAARVIDFGIAKDLHRSTLTQAGQVLGTILYMAPEQIEGRRPDARCDVFALGSTFYRLLVGEAPFADPDPGAIAERILNGEYARACERVPGLPQVYDAVLIQLLEPELRYRYQSMQEIADDLGRVLRGEMCSAPCLEAEGGVSRPLLGARRYVVGAEPGCHVRLTHSSVSPTHAQLRRQSRGWAVFDLRSAGGTFVGDERVEGPHPLRDGDVLRFGQQVLRFRDPREPR